MRNTVVAIIILALIGGFLMGFAIARQRYVPLLQANSALIIARDNELTSLRAKDTQMQEVLPTDTQTLYFLEAGQLMMDDGASISAVSKEASLSGGIRITTTGTVIKPNGTRFILSPGEFFGVK
ncbi:MAG: hypothetical protein KA035_02025 [Candidatus Levybacteria bacterium]|nr:hypothetical protein [Candidatus Levybacteria bacterium]